MTNNLTPYDTGARLEPKTWVTSTAGLTATNADDFGKVDFENDESATILTIYAEPTPGSDATTIVNIAVNFGEVKVLVADESEVESEYVSATTVRTVVLDAITASSAFGLPAWDALIRIASLVGLVVGQDETGARYVKAP